MFLSINQKTFLAICLFIIQFYSFKCNTIDDDVILSAQETEKIITKRLEQLSLTVHRKTEADRIRNKRQFNLNYLSSDNEG